jgi:NAD(P)H-quinone oxidoreductase subunit 5
MLWTGTRQVPIPLGSWVVLPDYQFEVKLEFDRLSVPFVILSFALCGVVGSFANKYMHRESGFNRFFVFYALFVLGMVITSLAGTIETLFSGWELVGLSSALLIAFYQERRAPVRNGLRVWVVYRVSDAALLIASIVLHHMTGGGDFDRLLGNMVDASGVMHAWPDGLAHIAPQQALIVGLLLLLAAAGKSALLPFSDWLPRAMEGPTPSSAVFYGALSVHLGAFLLLRVSPILDISPTLCVIIVIVGLSTAIFAAFTERVQTDIKCALSFASLTQVGLIVAEIGLGFRYVALVHIIGHACLRTMQFVRAPTLLHDYRTMDNAIGAIAANHANRAPQWIPVGARSWVYRWAMERGYLDALLNEFMVRPFLNAFRWCDRLERQWSAWVDGGAVSAPIADHGSATSATLEELL